MAALRPSICSVLAVVSLFLSGASGSPEKMKAAVLTSRSWDFKFHLEKLDVISVDVPRPGNGEVLVQVHASNINPVDHKIVEMAGLLWSYPHQLGIDLAGVVVSVGSGCQRIHAGDEVWGEATSFTKVLTTAGTYAQYAAVPESVLGLKPKSLSWLEAGAMPMVALTGYDALSWGFDSPETNKANVTVLVLGGTGGTGHIGIQMAKALGATKVITTCSGKNSAFVQSLGADQVIDYHSQNWYEVLAPKSVDIIYDCVGQKGTGDHAYASVLKDHGSFVTLLPSGSPSISSRWHRPDIRTSAPVCVGACSHYDRIDKIAALVEQDKLKVHIDVVYDLKDIVQAFNVSLGGHTVGKVAVRMPDPDLKGASSPDVFMV